MGPAWWDYEQKSERGSLAPTPVWSHTVLSGYLGINAITMSVLVTIVQPPDLTLGSGTESSVAPVTSPIVMWPGN